MKIDLKTIILFGMCLVFFGLWYFKTDKSSEDLISKLEKENIEIRLQRDSVDNIIDKLNGDIIEISEILDIKYEEIKDLNTKLSEATRDTEEAERRYRKAMKEMEERLKKYEDLKKNPPNREGDELIKSLREKLN